MEHKDKSIGFAQELVPLVHDRLKKVTFRLGNQYDFLEVGDTIMVRNSETGENFGEVKVTSLTKTTFKDLPIDMEGHEKYGSKEEQRKVFEEYYPGMVKDESPVLTIGFELID